MFRSVYNVPELLQTGTFAAFENRDNSWYMHAGTLKALYVLLLPPSVVEIIKRTDAT